MKTEKHIKKLQREESIIRLKLYCDLCSRPAKGRCIVIHPQFIWAFWVDVKRYLEKKGVKDVYINT